MNLLTKYLHEALETGRLVDVYRDNHDDETKFCRINQVSEYCVLATLVDEHGEYDGISIFRTDHITRLRWGGTDRDAQTKLAIRNGSLPTLPGIDLSSLPTIIESIQKHYGYVNVATEAMDRDICFIGEVLAIDEEHLLLHEYGTQKALDRSMIVLAMPDITLVEADGKYERDLLYLHKTI